MYFYDADESGDWLVGWDIEALERICWNDKVDKYCPSTPSELRSEFKHHGADAVFSLHLRNPIHNGHAMIIQMVINTCVNNDLFTRKMGPVTLGKSWSS